MDPQLEGPGGGVLLAAIDEAALQGQADDWLVAADTGHVVVLRTGPADEGAARKRIAVPIQGFGGFLHFVHLKRS